MVHVHNVCKVPTTYILLLVGSTWPYYGPPESICRAALVRFGAWSISRLTALPPWQARPNLSSDLAHLTLVSSAHILLAHNQRQTVRKLASVACAPHRPAARFGLYHSHQCLLFAAPTLECRLLYETRYLSRPCRRSSMRCWRGLDQVPYSGGGGGSSCELSHGT